MSSSSNDSDPSDLEDTLRELVRLAERGELTGIAYRVVDKDGKLSEVTAGFDNEAEAAAALTKLRKAAGDLH
jgi:hypothetical protein